MNLPEPPLSETRVSDADGTSAPPARKPPPYSEAFEAFWREYPETAGMSKRNAWKRWQGLTADEREQAVAALPAFRSQLAERRKRSADTTPLHAEGYLNQRRFETLLAAPAKSAAPWWTDPAKVAAMTPERWRKGIREHANGTWGVAALGPAPGHASCVVPEAIIREMCLDAIYDPHGLKRAGAVVPWVRAGEAH